MSGRFDFRLMKQLWMFLAVAEEEHFGRAASKLGMSQPPLTTQIQILEQALGITLFERSRRGTKLSAAGLAILPAMRRFADHMEKLEQEIRDVVHGQTGILQIGAITSAMMDTVPELLKKMDATYPNIKIYIREIDTVDAIPALQSGELDLAFGRLEGDMEGDISWRPVHSALLAVALDHENPLAALPTVPLARLSKEPMVIFSRKVSPVYFDTLLSHCQKAGFSPNLQHEVRSVSAQIAYVSCGQGVALVPQSMEKLSPDNVVIKPLTETIPVVTAAVAWQANRFNPLVEAALALLEDHPSTGQ